MCATLEPTCGAFEPCLISVKFRLKSRPSLCMGPCRRSQWDSNNHQTWSLPKCTPEYQLQLRYTTKIPFFSLSKRLLRPQMVPFLIVFVKNTSKTSINRFSRDCRGNAVSAEAILFFQLCKIGEGARPNGADPDSLSGAPSPKSPTLEDIPERKRLFSFGLKRVFFFTHKENHPKQTKKPPPVYINSSCREALRIVPAFETSFIHTKRPQ